MDTKASTDLPTGQAELTEYMKKQRKINPTWTGREQMEALIFRRSFPRVTKLPPLSETLDYYISNDYDVIYYKPHSLNRLSQRTKDGQ